MSTPTRGYTSTVILVAEVRLIRTVEVLAHFGDCCETKVFDKPDGWQIVQVEWDREVALITYLTPVLNDGEA